MLADTHLDRLLALLIALFSFRVLAQFLQWLRPVDFLPPFAAWQSGALPYTVLLASQLAIILAMLRVRFRIARGATAPRRTIGISLLALGAVYFAVMSGRLLIGLLVLPDHFWFGRYLPAVFHLVLASFVLLVGRFHYAHAAGPESR